ncbi:MAG: hypothetical protein AB8G99_19860, partial [Planctomycetaceae bacterium]
MARLILLFCLLVSTYSPAVEAQTPQRFEVGSHPWTDVESWNTRAVPGSTDSVFIPGWVGESIAGIPAGSEVVAGTILVGGRKGADGTVELIQAILRLSEDT